MAYCQSERSEAEAQLLAEQHRPAQLYRFQMAEEPQATFLRIVR